MRPSVIAVLGLAGCLFLGACTSSETTPIDLDGTVPLVEEPLVHGPSAEVEAEGERLARQQCLDDLSLDQGLVRVVEPETEVVVAEFRVDCSEVR